MSPLFWIFGFILLCTSQIVDCYQAQEFGSNDPIKIVRARRSLTDEIIKSLDLDDLDENGNTLLHRAVLENSLKDIQLLLKLKANPKTTNVLGQTPLALAIAQTSENSEVTQLLRTMETPTSRRCRMAGSKPRPPKCTDTIEETFELIEEGENSIEVTQPEEVLGTREVILVIGNSGAGKSTVAQLLAGDNSKMNVVSLPNDQLIIVDDGGKIGETTTLSHTLFPERVVDPTNGAIFYDCPGFSDTRCSSMDIAAQYFIQKVVGNVDSVKIILVVDYVALRKGGLRDGFTRVLDHTTRFLKDPPRFQNGLLMVVTKAPNFSPDSGATLTPELLQAGILDFLQEVKESLKPDDEGTPRKLSILEALMETDEVNSTSKRIIVLQTPLHCGPIQENQNWQRTKVQIKTKLQEQLEYIPVTEQDFSFSVSDSSRNRIHNLISDARIGIGLNLGLILSEVEKAIENEIPVLEEESFDDVLKVLNEMMSDVNNLLSTNSTLELVDLLAQFQSDTGINIHGEHLDKIKTFNKFLEFLTQVAGMEIPNQDEVWKKPIRHTIAQLEEERSWYSYLRSLFNKLSDYPTQTHLVNEGESERMSFTFVQGKILGDYKVKLLTLASDYNNVRNQEVTLKKFNQLEMVLDFVIRSITEVTYTTGRLTIIGNYIRMSALAPAIGNREDVTTIEIFSRHTLFIDADLVTFGKNLVFLAPNWEVFGEKLMNLDGAPGPAPEAPRDVCKMFCGSSKTLLGSPGASGSPGGPGGSFLGFNLQAHGLETLKFSLNGGVGGAGQSGGPGGNGVNGTNATWAGTFYDTHRKLSLSSLKGRVLERYYGSYVSNTYGDDFKLTMDGWPGKRSGDGGHGGDGGPGGRPGNLYLTLPPGKTLKSVDAKAGPQGPPGPGGPPGPCIRKGSSWKSYVSVSESQVFCFLTLTIAPCFRFWVGSPEWIEQPCIQLASTGAPGGNQLSYETPPKPSSPPSVFKGSVLRYQEFISKTPRTLITGSLLKIMSEEMVADPNLNLVMMGKDHHR